MIDNFMKSRIDARLYGFMRCLSAIEPDEGLLKSTLTMNKKAAMEVCTPKTFTRHVLRRG